MAALPLTDKISQSVTKTKKQNMFEVKFGNGYAMYGSVGYNNQYDDWTIEYTILDETEKNTMEAFFNAHTYVNYFTWTAFGDSVEKRWRMKKDSYTVTPLSGNLYKINFEIFQVFDL